MAVSPHIIRGDPRSQNSHNTKHTPAIPPYQRKNDVLSGRESELLSEALSTAPTISRGKKHNNELISLFVHGTEVGQPRNPQALAAASIQAQQTANNGHGAMQCVASDLIQ